MVYAVSFLAVKKLTALSLSLCFLAILDPSQGADRQGQKLLQPLQEHPLQAWACKDLSFGLFYIRLNINLYTSKYIRMFTRISVRMFNVPLHLKHSNLKR